MMYPMYTLRADVLLSLGTLYSYSRYVYIYIICVCDSDKYI